MSHGMLLPMAVFAYVAPEWLRLTTRHMHAHTVWKSLRYTLLSDMQLYNLLLSKQQDVARSSGGTD